MRNSKWSDGSPIGYQMWMGDNILSRNESRYRGSVKTYTMETNPFERWPSRITYHATMKKERLDMHSMQHIRQDGELLQPAISQEGKHCAGLNIFNFRYPQWIMVKCGDKLSSAIICKYRKQNITNLNYTRNDLQFYYCDRQMILYDGLCFNIHDYLQKSMSSSFKRDMYYKPWITILNLLRKTVKGRYASIKKSPAKEIELTQAERGTLFQCQDGSLISRIRICDGMVDCPTQDTKNDESNCLCIHQKRKTTKSHSFCRNLCQRPQCRCLTNFYQDKSGGCKPYLSNAQGIKMQSTIQ